MNHRLLLRFSLRSLFLSITVVAIVLGIWLERAQRQRRAIALLKQIELCRIGYGFNELGYCPPRKSTYRETWIERTLGIDSIHSVINIEIPVDRLERAMPYLQKLPALREVLIYPYDAESGEEEARQLQRGFSRIRGSLPGVKATERLPCMIDSTTIPVVG